MTARIYQRPKNAMQSGRAHTNEWMLEFVPAEARKADGPAGDTPQPPKKDRVKPRT